jgi:hypothetical protein
MFSRFDVTDFSWVNDDWLVFSLFDENDKSGKRSGGGLVSVRRDGEKIRPLIKREFESLFPEHGNNPLEPTNSMLALGAPGTNEIIVGEAHYDTNYTEYEHTTLLRMDVATGATRSLFADQPAPPGKITGWLINLHRLTRGSDGRKKKPASRNWRAFPL